MTYSRTDYTVIKRKVDYSSGTASLVQPYASRVSPEADLRYRSNSRASRTLGDDLRNRLKGLRVGTSCPVFYPMIGGGDSVS